MELKSVKIAAEAVERQRQFVAMLRQSACDPHAPQLDGLPHAKQQSSHVESAVCKVEAAENDLRGLEFDLVEMQISLTAEIFRRVHRRAVAEILCRRYVRLEQFGAIAAEMCLSEPRIYALHRQGVKEYREAKSTAHESSVAMTCTACRPRRPAAETFG